jgi:hypothetical protein
MLKHLCEHSDGNRKTETKRQKKTGTKKETKTPQNMAYTTHNLAIVRVSAAYRAQYDEPLTLRAGEILDLGTTDSEFDGWVWCKNHHGGWIPGSLIEYDGIFPVAADDYSAVELSARLGEILEVLREEQGWLWCENLRGESGWIPKKNVVSIRQMKPASVAA